MGLSVSAFNLLRSLLGLSPSVLALPKYQLAGKLGMGESKLQKLLTDLSIVDAITRIPGRTGHPTALSINSSSPIVLKAMALGPLNANHVSDGPPMSQIVKTHGLSPKTAETSFSAANIQSDHGTSKLLNPEKSHGRHGTTVNPEAKKVMGSKTQQIAAKNPLEKLSTPEKQKPNSGIGNVSPFGRNRQLAQPDEAEIKELPCLKMTMFQLQVAARTKQLVPALREQLLRLRKGAYKAWWNAAITGMAERLHQQFMDRWNQRTGTRYFSRSGDEAHWRQACANIIELDITCEKLLDIAFECHPKSMRWPTPRYMASNYLKEIVPAWVPPEERNAINIVDGEDFDSVVKRSKEALEGAPELASPTRMPLARNWPGLYGRKSNKREDPDG